MARILIVDDSAFMRAKLRVMLESGGHEVVGLAPNGKQALEMFASLHPELVTLDYMMAGKNGEEVLREMVQQDPEARVIMISGSGDRTIEERALQIGARLFMEKPIVPTEILKVIDQVMEA